MKLMLASARRTAVLILLWAGIASQTSRAQVLAPAPGSEPPPLAASVAHVPQLASTTETAQAQPAAIEDGLELYFMGKRRSTLEPCGCHTKQQGGLQLEASIYLQAPTTRPILKLDAGEWTNPLAQRIPLESMKTRYLLRGLDQLGMDAVNVSISDIQAPADFFESLRQQAPTALKTLVSATIYKKSKPEERAFPAWRIVERKLADGKTIKIGITGATALRAQIPLTGMATSTNAEEVTTTDFIARQPQEPLKNVVEKLRPQVDVLILLYAGDFESTFKMAQDFQQFDFIVSTAPVMERNTLYYREGPVQVLIVPAVQGKEIGHATVVPTPEGKWNKQGEPEILIVSRELPYAPSMQGLIDEFKKETQTLQVQADPNAPRIFAGAESCQQCHQDQYRQWMGNPHANAMQTLVNVGQQFNPDCVKCHVTGYREGNGFYSLADGGSQMMLNVQCEVCHGPSLEHVHTSQKTLGASQWMKPEQAKIVEAEAAKAMPKKAVPAEVCKKCHTPETDPEFDYEKRVVWVNHSRPYEVDQQREKSKLKMIPMKGAPVTSDTLKKVHHM